MPRRWEDIGASKRKKLLESIPKEWLIPEDIKPPDSQLNVVDFPERSGWFTKKELEITNTSATDLVRKLAKGEWSSEEVTLAFCKRASVAHQLVNCLSETMFDFALETARSRDKHLRQTGKPIGPLHGLPVSIKDCFDLVGVDSSIGFSSRVDKPAKHNAAVVDIMLNAGAVLYVKTNVPTAMMMLETVNNVTGRTLNPLNRDLTPGGSSGGESALIAFAGSPLGIGGDVAGSLRIPAACTGIFTLKPSAGRFPIIGCASGLPGQEAVQAVTGPLARSLQDCFLFSEAVAAAEPWKLDTKTLPIPWHAVEHKRKLKLGVMWTDGIVTPTPPIRRALEQTVTKLEAAGHEILDWQPEGHLKGLQLFRQIISADGGKSLRKDLEPTQEPFRPEQQLWENASELGVYELWQIHQGRDDLCQQYFNRWTAAGIDGILCPTTPYASVGHGGLRYLGYTAIFNLLDYSSISFPCGLAANKDLDRAPTDYTPLNDFDTQVQGSYNADSVDGMPLSLQIVAQKLEDEKVFTMARTILEVLRPRPTSFI
ncbi:uncharacterized protein Z520_05334 [Fonsecaea multimorphosa CBS 102226]|uniref:amidase n=1 Tax=Fonsecaea multimorphosa CBS 102226 TaxID=1442371 RepID=A0A0D2KQA2_9EURO|nr:uncharacterized protein Z520_05334 [Fonsecaea multimorphosa CBS 102226]KIX98873.1 hypothetical protein Z520_05334 [Fonsecaea multimorphosa CBS 102226]OAL25151.1 hypothetical protein AYO22_05028 [Fonsecaea multimorphosa]